jgi:hypothetical protein
MSQYDSFTPPGKDPQLWYVARKRASFRGHLVSYILVNAFLWLLWIFSASNSYRGIPWPLWSTFGWGIGLAFHYASAYLSTGERLAEKEYEKLSNKS